MKREQATIVDSSFQTRVVATSHYGEHAPLPAGTVMTIEFELQGRSFMAINGGPQFQFTRFSAGMNPTEK